MLDSKLQGVPKKEGLRISALYLFYCAMWAFRDAFKKKVHMGGNCPNLSLPPPLFKSREQNRKELFGALDPPPPSKLGKILILS